MAQSLNVKTFVFLVASFALGVVTWTNLPQFVVLFHSVSLGPSNQLVDHERIFYSRDKPPPPAPVPVNSPSKLPKTPPSLPNKTVDLAAAAAAAATKPIPVKTATAKPKLQEGHQVFQIYNHSPGFFQHFNFSECSYSRCEMIQHPLRADLVMVKADKLKNYPLPPRRRDALLLIYSKEPPTFKRFRHLNRTDLMKAVNWTRFVFDDSTFRAFYGRIIEKLQPEKKDYDAIFKGKSRQAAWFVSHCETQSRREDYVARMSRELDVDVFGKCGNLTCGKYGFEMGGQKEACTQMLSNDYKFYLSFENSMCSDYVTEKLYNMYEDVDVIPVVRGRANYSTIAPKGTYIDASDFKSPEALGKYLAALGKNKNRYTDMLRTKSRYTVVPAEPKFHCEFCKALHTRRHILSVYSDFYQWLMSHCWEPGDF